MRVLIIDDNQIELEVIKLLLVGSNIEVVTSCDSVNAVNTAVACSPDIIILDLFMPNKDGFELCRELRNNYKTSNIPVLMLSGSDNMVDKLKCFNQGCIDYVVKPVTKDSLVHKIRKYGNIGIMFKSMEAIV